MPWQVDKESWHRFAEAAEAEVSKSPPLHEEPKPHFQNISIRAKRPTGSERFSALLRCATLAVPLTTGTALGVAPRTTEKSFENAPWNYFGDEVLTQSLSNTRRNINIRLESSTRVRGSSGEAVILPQQNAVGANGSSSQREKKGVMTLRRNGARAKGRPQKLAKREGLGLYG